jgi:2'-5' RNA ligase
MKKVSFWLIPAVEDKRFFQEIINTLAQKYAAAVFTPHVTLYSGHLAPDEPARQLVERATAGVPTFNLEIVGLSYTDQFTKTLFVQFQPSAVLREISERIRRNVAQPSGYHLDPHLSLLYHPLNRAEKVRLVHSITIPKNKIDFDEVRAVSTPGPTQTREDVARWQELYRTKFDQS